MRVIPTNSYSELSVKAADIIIKLVSEKPNATLGLATGGTPKGTYKQLILDHYKNGTDYRRIQTVNLDEYVGLSPEHPNSYNYFMKENLFKDINIEKNNTSIPNGNASDLLSECRRYDQLIHSKGGVDLQVLGIGENGHIGFNEPGTSFSQSTHLVTLTHETRKANARFFDNINEVPTQAITMGIKNILESRSILLLASGENKATAIAQLLNSKGIDERFPASALQMHNNVLIIADEAALSMVNEYKRSALND